MIISFSASVTGINTLLSKKFAWKINDLSTENLLDPVLNYTEQAPFPIFGWGLGTKLKIPYLPSQQSSFSIDESHSSVTDCSIL